MEIVLKVDEKSVGILAAAIAAAMGSKPSKPETVKDIPAGQPTDETQGEEKAQKPGRKAAPRVDFSTVDNDADRLELIKTEVTKLTKNKKGPQAKEITAAFGVQRPSELDPSQYEAAYNAFAAFVDGADLAEVIKSVKDAAPAATTATTTLTLQEVIEKAKEYVGENGQDKFKEILSGFKVSKVSELKPAQYGDFFAALAGVAETEEEDLF